MTTIEISGLSLAYAQDGTVVKILDRLDLKVARGEFIAIVGPSGVGKSTLLRVLMGLARPSSGTVRVVPDKSADRAMALVFQDARLLPWRRALANAAFGLEKLGLARHVRDERALAALRSVGLADFARRFPSQLSGGQRQRVALARALAVRPAILLMDEPFSALDALTRQALQDELVRIWQQFNKTVLFVTHDIDEAVYLADRVVALGGRPGEVKASLAINIPRPRSRADQALRAYVEKVQAGLVADAVERDDWII
jgi:NitT/TauT family transport system ATP-binding protein